LSESAGYCQFLQDFTVFFGFLRFFQRNDKKLQEMMKNHKKLQEMTGNDEKYQEMTKNIRK